MKSITRRCRRDSMPPLLESDNPFSPIISNIPGYPVELECIAAAKIEGNVYRLESQPLNRPGLSYGDIVRTQQGELPFPTITEVVTRSGREPKIIAGIHPNRKGREIIDELSKCAFCEAVGKGVFTVSALKEDWLAIQEILHLNNIEMLPFWWEKPVDFSGRSIGGDVGHDG